VNVVKYCCHWQLRNKIHKKENMKRIIFALMLFAASVFGTHAHAQGTKISPQNQIAWPTSCSSGVYAPSSNTCVTTPTTTPVQLNPVQCGTANAPAFCASAPVANACGYMAAAIGALPQTGGTIDATGFQGNQACTVNPFSTAVSNGVLLLGPANFQTTQEWIVPSAFSWRTIGLTRKSESAALNTTIQAVTGFPTSGIPVFRLGSGTTSYGDEINNLTIDCNSVSGTTGLYSTDIQEESTIEHVTILNCPAYGIHINGNGNDGTGPFWAQNYTVRDLYVLPLTAGTGSTVACEFDGAFTSFHELTGATCGGSRTPIADDFVFDKIYAGSASDLNAEDAAVGYLLGNANPVTGLTINGMQSSAITGTVVSIKSTDASVLLTGIVNGGDASPATLTDSSRLSAPLTDFSIGLYAIGTGNSANGFTPVVSTSPAVKALFNGLAISNGKDTPNELVIDSGATASQGQGIEFTDRGNLKWSVAEDAGFNWEVFDDTNSFQPITAQAGGQLDLRARGSAAVNFNDEAGSGTAGVQFFSGGATPVAVAAITGAGALELHGGITISAGTGAPSSTCGTSPIGSGSLYLQTNGTASTTLYVCSGTTWTAVTVP
jgi:hypothetical protein